MRRWLVCALLVVTCTASACGSSQADEPVAYARELSDRVDPAAVFDHLEEFQRVADRHGGNRRSGTPGYDAGVNYVAGLLSAAGFEVSTPEFEAALFTVQKEALSVDGVTVSARAVQYSASGPAGGVRGPLRSAPRDPLGCSATDYDGAEIAGAVAVVRRGGCYLSDKAAAATSRGASALIVVNDTDEKVFSAGFLEDDHVQIPVLSVSRVEGENLIEHGGSAIVAVTAAVENHTVRNVIAQTHTGSTDDVVMVGAHLDSVRLGPGINDNASGVAAVLETALEMGPEPPIAHAVRFAFWGAEEEWLLGSQSYVGSLDGAALADIALYLNFDMVGSPNPGYLVLDTDASPPPDPDVGVTIPTGSPAIENAIRDRLTDRGVTPGDLVFDGRGDWNPFAQAGIPVGALCTGNEEIKTVEQQALWGGSAGVPFDPNYHSAEDTIANVSQNALSITAPTIAFLVGLYAQEQSGRYGVPAREQRSRHVLTP